jgi:hypothetical protein
VNIHLKIHNVYKLNVIHAWILKRLKNMKKTRHTQNGQSTTAVIVEDSIANVPLKKRKEQAEQALYITRI